MKKIMMAAVALICMTMVSVALTACGSDDDDKEMSFDYYVSGSITASAYSMKKDDADPWNAVLKQTDEKVNAILQKYSKNWNVKATSSNLQQVVTINDNEAKQLVAEMKVELNKVFADLEPLKSEYPNDYISYLVSIKAMNNAPENGNKGWNAFINETVSLRFGRVLE